MSTQEPRKRAMTLDTMTQEELWYAPELCSIVALDTALQATMTILENGHPCFGNKREKCRFTPDDNDESLARSICILTQALRANLSAFYAIVQAKCLEKDSRDIRF